MNLTVSQHTPFVSVNPYEPKLALERCFFLTLPNLLDCFLVNNTFYIFCIWLKGLLRHKSYSLLLKTHKSFILMEVRNVFLSFPREWVLLTNDEFLVRQGNVTLDMSFVDEIRQDTVHFVSIHVSFAHVMECNTKCLHDNTK